MNREKETIEVKRLSIFQSIFFWSMDGDTEIIYYVSKYYTALLNWNYHFETEISWNLGRFSFLRFKNTSSLFRNKLYDTTSFKGKRYDYKFLKRYKTRGTVADIDYDPRSKRFSFVNLLEHVRSLSCGHCVVRRTATSNISTRYIEKSKNAA